MLNQIEKNSSKMPFGVLCQNGFGTDWYHNRENEKQKGLFQSLFENLIIESEEIS